MLSSRVWLVAAILDSTALGRRAMILRVGRGLSLVTAETPGATVPTVKSNLISHSQQGATYEEWIQNVLTRLPQIVKCYWRPPCFDSK